MMLLELARDGVMPMDYNIAEKLRESGKDVVVVANNIDDERNERFSDVFKIFVKQKIFLQIR